jgi:cell volume regulation protein A
VLANKAFGRDHRILQILDLTLTLTFIIAAVIIIIGFLADALFRKTGLPDILFLLILGIIFGPVLGVFSKEELIPVTPYLIELSLIMILFYGGMDMNLSKAVRQSARATILAVTYFALVTTSVTFVAKFIFDTGWLEALMFGPMIAGTSSIVVIPLSKKLKMSEESSLTLSLESTITDVLNIVFFFAILGVYLSGSLSVVTVAENIAMQFGVGMLVGFAVGLVWFLVLYKIRNEPYTYISTLAVLILTVMASELLGGSGVLSALSMGLVIGNHKDLSSFLRIRIRSERFEELKKILAHFQSELTFLIRTFFFVFLGLIYDTSLNSVTFGLLIGFIFLVLDLGLRYVAVRLSVVRSSMRQDTAIMTLLCGQGLAHATLSVIPQQYGIPNAQIYPVIVVTLIILTNAVTTLGSFIVARRHKRPWTA